MPGVRETSLLFLFKEERVAGLSFAGTIVCSLPDKRTLTVITHARQSAGYSLLIGCLSSRPRAEKARAGVGLLTHHKDHKLKNQM